MALLLSHLLTAADHCDQSLGVLTIEVIFSLLHMNVLRERSPYTEICP